MKLYLHMKEPAVTTLGPGVRFVVWVQGCHRHCPGCVAPESQPMTTGTPVEVEALAWEIALSRAEGLTLSGGEPFLQAAALAELVRQVQAVRPMGVIVFTGYRLEELQQMPEAGPLLAVTDLLVDGPYEREKDDHRGLRGSSNQRLLALTDRYRDQLEALETAPRRQEIFYHTGEIHAVGLPTRSGIYPALEHNKEETP